MTTTCQQIIDRAKSYNALNANLASDAPEIMTRIRAIQQRIFTAIGEQAIPRYTVSTTGNSNNAASAREVDLSAVAPPIERILKVFITSGATLLTPVSELDTEARESPRYFVRGQKIIEVESDWGASGVVGLTVLYMQGPTTALAPTDSPSSKNISVPDEWIDVVVIPLAMYLHQKDPGRDPAEYARLAEEYARTWYSFLGFLTNYSGVIDNRRLLLPPPPEPLTRKSEP